MPISLIDSLIQTGRMPPPAKDSSGQFVWSDADLANAREAMKIDRRKKGFRRRKAVPA